MKLLLNSGADPTLRNCNGEGALHVMAHYGDYELEEVLKILEERGFNLDVQDIKRPEGIIPRCGVG